MNKRLLAVIGIVAILAACTEIDDDRTPSYPVAIKLNSAALWTTYGVSSLGDSQVFSRSKGLPKNYSYTATTYTGYGGVLLVYGYDFSNQTYAPLAYDMSCPVENNTSALIAFDEDALDAYCTTCGSRYDVMWSAGSPTEGTAVTKKYGLTRYTVTASNGGYIISN